MLVIEGRFREARVYWRYVLALFRPGVEVPVFGEPAPFADDVERPSVEDLKVVIDEGRRQLDRQVADLESNRSRAGTLLTIGVAEMAVLSASAHRVFAHPAPLWVVWAFSVILAVLAVAGAASLVTSRAEFGRTDTRTVASFPLPVLRQLALGYAQSVGAGEETVRTRITVLRDGVLLAVVSAVLYAVIWPFVSSPTDTPQPAPHPSPTGVSTTCPATCTTSSPSAPTPKTTIAVPGPGLTTPNPRLSTPE